MKLIATFLTFILLCSCSSEVKVDSIGDEGAIAAIPIAQTLTPANLTQGTQSLIQLSYKSIEFATSCQVTNLVHASATVECSCNSIGVCEVGVTGEPSYTGVASFDYTVSVASTTSNSITVEFTIDAPEPSATQLVFTQQPTLSKQNEVIAPTIIVELRDADNNLFDSSANVTLSLSASGNPLPGTAILGGTLTVAAVSGVATFNDITLDLELNNYQFSASSLGTSSANSEWFDIVGATPIARSVGYGNANSLADGLGTNGLSIQGKTAVFDNSIALNIGVGDAIQYDSATKIAFITGIAGQNVYQVRNAAGADALSVTNDTGWTIYRAYASVSAVTDVSNNNENDAIDNALEDFDPHGATYDITSATGSDEVWFVALYAEAVNQGTWIRAWDTDTKNYVKLFTPHRSNEVGISQRHNGVWDNAKATIQRTTSGSYQDAIRYQIRHLKIEGLQLQIIGTHGWSSCIKSVNADNVILDIEISNNILRSGGGGGSHSGFYGDSNDSPDGVFKIHHNIFYDFQSYAFIGYSNTTAVFYVSNNTVINSSTGIRAYQGTTVAKNNLVQTCATDCYTGTFDVSSSNNISNLADAPGTNSQNISIAFVDAASDDYHLAIGDTDATGNGEDLSTDTNFAHIFDIDGDLKTISWDIGADQK
ncbi:hypothetical protein HOB30_05520 [Candidatus Falkowbacteria bacterium]|jgi:hypothetical protein|nr:hypothetical protein [Candidatus Falkowbacteria bacterium]